MRTDGETRRIADMTKLILASRNVEKAPKTALSFFDRWLRGLRADLDAVTKKNFLLLPATQTR